MCKKMKDNTF